MSHSQDDEPGLEDCLVLLTGATGYVGGRLLSVLEAAGRRVRCLARRPDELSPRVGQHTEVVGGDVLDRESLTSALEGVRVAYYLIHSMGASGDFESNDRRAAENFAAAARAAGVQRIIYLGGLGRDVALSPHLRSRHEVGEVLRASGVPVIEFRASIVIGSGSLSFELIRALVERLPVMITPRWVRVRAQPISISDLLAYLEAALDVAGEEHPIYEIGGADKVAYGDLMREYARQRGLRRFMLPVPVLTPHLSSLWLGLVTPVYARIGRKIVDSMRHETVVEDDTALRTFAIRPKTVEQAVAAALVNEDHEFAATRWSDSVSAGTEPRDWGGVRFGNRLVDSRAVRTDAPREAAFAAVRRIGGANGWYYGNVLWRLRGFLDVLFGGVGLRRGRREPDRLRVGDTLDWWRVGVFEPGRRLGLEAEMKLPGRAWLEFEVEPDGTGSIIRQTAIFDPVGLLGLAYWYAIYPLHGLVFAGMLNGLAAAAVRDNPRPLAPVA